ncbi:hypothetical protein [Bosea sp. LC85]|uniref:hypothetical protein n=1 Tax=Bosea sp. LC85 TaxID=1502851 RepID=UPI001377AEFD|nr:hypothetical protein [Bosea sp. LC85]
MVDEPDQHSRKSVQQLPQRLIGPDDAATEEDTSYPQRRNLKVAAMAGFRFSHNVIVRRSVVTRCHFQ